MKLFYSHASPYARQCRIALDLCGLLDHAELVLTNPLEDKQHRKINPLGKVPALADGEKVVIDSPLICEYINYIGQHTQISKRDLFPYHCVNYFNFRCQHAAANGVIDAAVATVMEARRQTEKSDYWLQRWQTSIHATIDSRDTKYLGDAESLNIASVSMACALAYLDFRLPDLQWRIRNDVLARWFEEISESHWMKNSAPI